MSLSIGTLTGRIELEDGVTSVLTTVERRLGSANSAWKALDSGVKGVAVAVGAASIAMVGAVTGISAAIVKLGTDGSRIQGISDEFARLAKEANTTSEALIGPLSSALRGTVDDTDLMIMLNKSLGAGVKLTAADMTAMGESARAMGKAMGTDASQGLETINSALTTGNTRMLKRMGVIVDVKSAEDKFAKSIGATRDQLNDVGKLEAKRIGILDALKARVDKMGVSEMSIAEQFKQGRVAIDSWFDSLALAVEKSTAVQQAIDAVRNELEKAFGGSTAKDLLDWAIGAVDWFANKIRDAVPYIVVVKDWATRLWNELKIVGEIAVEAANKLIDAWRGVPDWMKGVGLSIVGTTVASVALLETISLYATTVSGVKDSVELTMKYIAGSRLVEAIRGLWIVVVGYATGLNVLTTATTAQIVANDGLVYANLAVGSSWAVAFWPIAAAVVTLAALGAAVYVVYRNWDDVKRVLQPITDAMGQLWRILKNSLILAWRELGEMLDTALGLLLRIPNAFSSATTGAETLGDKMVRLKDLFIDIMPGIKQSLELLKLLDAYLARKERESRKSSGFGPTGYVPLPGFELKYEQPPVTPLPTVVPSPNYIADASESAVKSMNELIKEFNYLNSQGLMTDSRFQSMSSSAEGLTDTFAKLGMRVPQAGQAFQRLFMDVSGSVPRTIVEVRAASAALAASMLQNAETTKAGLQEIANKHNEATAALLASSKDYDEQRLQRSLHGSALELRQIDVAEAAKITAMANSGVLKGKLLDDWTTKVQEDAQHQRDIVNKTQGTIDERLRNSGIQTVADLEKTARSEREIWLRMQLGPVKFSQVAIDAQADVVTAADKAARGTKTAWERVSTMWSTLGGMFENINSKIGQSFQVLGGMFDVFEKNAKGAADTLEKMSNRVVAGVSAITTIVSSAITGTNRLAVTARGALTGAAMGVAVGASIAAGMHAATIATGAMTMGIGAVVGALAMMVIAWNAAGAAARAANREADAKLADLRAGLVKTYGSIEQVDIMGQMLGVDLRGAWGDTTAAGLKHFAGLLDEFNAQLKTLTDSATEFGLTWMDMSGDMARFFSGKIADDLINKFTLLHRAGIDEDKIIKGMSGSMSQFIVDSIKAGTKIPAAMQPMIEKMIRMGTLTDAAARAILGMAEVTGPSWADIKDAAERYGLTLDQLGQKAQQLAITDAALQIVKDFELLVSAGVDPAVLATSGMGEQVQGLVDAALAYGSALPETMRPLLEAMRKAGTLTDEAGNQMEDLSKLTFAEDLSGMFETLMEKLDALIEKISTGLGGALGDIAKGDYTALVRVKVDPWSEVQPESYAGGGVVYASRGYFAPRGSDTVPAMLTPGERVLSVAQNREYEQGGGTNQPIVLQVGDEQLARVVVKLARKKNWVRT